MVLPAVVLDQLRQRVRVAQQRVDQPTASSSVISQSPASRGRSARTASSSAWSWVRLPVQPPVPDEGVECRDVWQLLAPPRAVLTRAAVALSDTSVS